MELLRHSRAFESNGLTLHEWEKARTDRCVRAVPVPVVNAVA